LIANDTPSSASPVSVSAAPHAAPSIARPTFRFMRAHPAHWIALGFGSGLPRWAPGTVGTLWAWVAFLVMQIWFSPATIGWVILASLPIGWWACTVTARHMNVADPGSIVWDEVVAFWLVLWLIAPAGFWGQAFAFALFRYFDAAKPGPVAWADALFKQRDAAPGAVRWGAAGFGILFDDLVAAFCTLLAIALWRAFA
jgi:phosphatidylglycerophosphatase A